MEIDFNPPPERLEPLSHHSSDCQKRLHHRRKLMSQGSLLNIAECSFPGILRFSAMHPAFNMSYRYFVDSGKTVRIGDNGQAALRYVLVSRAVSRFYLRPRRPESTKYR